MLEKNNKEKSTLMGPEGQVVIGIDPGSRFVGFGVLRKVASRWQALDYGLIKLPEKQSLSERLSLLGQSLEPIFLNHRPTLAIVEKVFLGKNVESAFILGHARGIILATAAKHQCEIKEYAARSVKKGVTGHGGAQKHQVQMMVQAALGVRDVARDDVSDALALALYGARQWEISQRISQGSRGLNL